MNKTLLCLAVTLALSAGAQAFFDPAAGRWLSRDPIGERGGVNQYVFVRNNGLNRLDYLGLTENRDCRYKICYRIDRSFYEAFKGSDSKPNANVMAAVRKAVEAQVGGLEQHIKSCIERGKCCCKAITVEKDLPPFDADRTGFAFEDDINLNMKLGGGASEATVMNAFSDMSFDESCDVRILLTGQLIETGSTNAVDKAPGVTLGDEPCGNRPIILRPLLSPNLLAHELGHLVGWHDTQNPMIWNGVTDSMHSGIQNNLMGYDQTSDDAVAADDQWCEKFCKCVESKSSSE